MIVLFDFIEEARARGADAGELIDDGLQRRDSASQRGGDRPGLIRARTAVSLERLLRADGGLTFATGSRGASRDYTSFIAI